MHPDIVVKHRHRSLHKPGQCTTWNAHPSHTEKFNLPAQLHVHFEQFRQFQNWNFVENLVQPRYENWYQSTTRSQTNPEQSQATCSTVGISVVTWITNVTGVFNTNPMRRVPTFGIRMLTTPEQIATLSPLCNSLAHVNHDFHDQCPWIDLFVEQINHKHREICSLPLLASDSLYQQAHHRRSYQLCTRYSIKNEKLSYLHENEVTVIYITVNCND